MAAPAVAAPTATTRRPSIPIQIFQGPISFRARRSNSGRGSLKLRATKPLVEGQKMGHGVERDLCSFNIPPTVRTKLTRAGFRTSKDLEGVSVVELTKDADITHKEALSVLKELRGEAAQRGGGLETPKGGVSAMEMYRQAQKHPRIITFCGELDEMLGGGVASGEVTEFCGAPGIGKTQMGIQLAIDAFLPTAFGGPGGHAVYIDTEGSFMVDRVNDIAKAFVSHIRRMAGMRNEERMCDAALQLTVEYILSNIHYFRVHDYAEQVAVIHQLPKFLATHPDVRVIVIDSVAFHFRHDWEDFALRSRLLNSLAQRLSNIAINHQAAVVLTNQVTTKVTAGSTFLAPALGESWAHACTSRVMLSWENGQRVATLVKSPSRKSDCKTFQVTSAGVRGMGKKRPRPEGADNAENRGVNAMESR